MTSDLEVEEDLALDFRVYGSCYWKVVDGRKVRIHPQDIRYGRDSAGTPIDGRTAGAPALPKDAEIEQLRTENARLEALVKRCVEGMQTAAEMRVTHESERLRAALEKIAKGEGRFSRDHLTHASNTIEDMKQLAMTALAALTMSADGGKDIPL